MILSPHNNSAQIYLRGTWPCRQDCGCAFVQIIIKLYTVIDQGDVMSWWSLLNVRVKGQGREFFEFQVRGSRSWVLFEFQGHRLRSNLWTWQSPKHVHIVKKCLNYLLNCLSNFLSREIKSCILKYTEAWMKCLLKTNIICNICCVTPVTCSCDSKKFFSDFRQTFPHKVEHQVDLHCRDTPKTDTTELSSVSYSVTIEPASRPCC